MLTMGDMNNLLLCFFIVLMGDISVITQEEFLYVLSSFKGNVSLMTGGRSMSRGQLMDLGHNIIALPSSEQQRFVSRMMKKAEEAFKPEIQSRYVRLKEDERGLVITLASDVFFDPGSARIKNEMRPIVRKIGNVLKELPHFIRIEGHTDNSPVAAPTSRERYKTNWELSSARSLNVLHYLIDESGVKPSQLSAVAFGEYRPIEDNSTPEGRAYNRRVDIVVLKERIPEESKDRRIPRPLPDEEWR